MSKRVLLTGATGFVGRALLPELLAAGYVVRAALRSSATGLNDKVESIVVGDIGPQTDWTAALRDVDVVMHAAARAHVLGDDPANENLYIDSNARGSIRLAEAAAESGVGRFIFLSSVKVNGEDSGAGSFRSTDTPAPQDAYGRSKAMAEEGLWRVARSGMEVACVRLPLVYGPGVRANFLRLLGWVDRGWPLPLGSVHNRRSLVSTWNLCSLLVRLIEHPNAAGRTWMVSDGEDLSTPELIRRIGSAMNRSVRLLPVPLPLLRAAARLFGKEAEAMRLCGSLAVDIEATRRLLDWQPPLCVDESLIRTVRWYGVERHPHAH